MSQDLLAYWKPETADAVLSRNDFLGHSASDQYGRVSVGDVVWIVTVRSGVLVLLGRIRVGEVTDARGAARVLGTTDLWEADFHILAEPDSAMRLRCLPITHLASSLRFKSRSGRDRLELTDGGVNPQQLQTMRILTSDSAGLLEKALSGTKAQPPSSIKSAGRVFGEKKTETVSRKSDIQRREVTATLQKLQAAGRKSGDLIKAEYRDVDRTEIELNGLCYVLCECMHHLFPNLLTPCRVSWGDGTTHWFLRFPDATILDAIGEGGEECCDPDEYAAGRPRAFFTKLPSKRARTLAARAGLTLER